MNKKFKIKDLPENERPREKLLRYGADSLSNAELLAILLKSGTKNEDVITLSNRILGRYGGINGIFNSSYDNLININGIGVAKASEIIALSELFKRFKAFKDGEKYRITMPKDAADYVMQEMRYLKKEYFKILMLNTKNEIIGEKNISIGTLNSAMVHPREVFVETIKNHSSSLIICHNHPSGDPMPSNEDKSITSRIKQCGKIIGIELLDHIIIGNGIYTSMKEEGFL